MGAAHALSWDVRFPSTDAQLLFLVNTIVLLVWPAVVGVVMICGAFGLTVLRWKYELWCLKYVTSHPWLAVLGSVVCFGVYAFARVTLIFLVLYSFSSLPAGVYGTKGADWLGFIPFLH